MRLKKHRRAILLATNFLSVFGWAMITPLYALFVADLGGNSQTAALSWSFYTLMAGILIILLGRLEDRTLQKGKLLTIGYAIQTVGAATLFFAVNVEVLLGGLGIYALGTGIVIPAWKQMYTRAEDRGKEASEWGIFHGGNMILISCAAAVSSVVILGYGFKGITAIMLGAHLLATFTSIKLHKNT